MPSLPTAKQSEVVGQVMSQMVAVDLDRLSTVQAVPPSVVATATEAVPVAPRATQSDGVEHETLLRTVTAPGRLLLVHVRPPSEVVITPAPDPVPLVPTATQSNGVGHERPFGLAIPPGGLCASHRRPRRWWQRSPHWPG
jgi:hypothetical protein